MARMTPAKAGGYAGRACRAADPDIASLIRATLLIAAIDAQEVLLFNRSITSPKKLGAIA